MNTVLVYGQILCFFGQLQGVPTLIDTLTHYIDLIAKIIEVIGVLIMFFGLFLALYKALRASSHFNNYTYIEIRQTVGKSILLGLEVLIAADIVATVVTEPSLRSVLVLGFIVLIRTFLSLSLQVELEGRFSWQNKKSASDK